jgi:hypothetical protein
MIFAQKLKPQQRLFAIIPLGQTPPIHAAQALGDAK